MVVRTCCKPSREFIGMVFEGKVIGPNARSCPICKHVHRGDYVQKIGTKGIIPKIFLIKLPGQKDMDHYDEYVDLKTNAGEPA
jgi:hypothetical protein